jgi:transposase
MEGPPARVLILTELQRRVLQSIVRRTRCPQAVGLRGRVVLSAGDGLGNSAIARRLGCSRELARRWRDRFLAAQQRWAADGGDWDESIWTQKILDELEDRPRSGAPPTFTAEQLCRIVALACELKPTECGRPVTHWTSRELADEAVHRQIVVSISPRHVGRLLKYGGPQAASGASVAQQPRPAGRSRGIPAAVQGGG